MTVKHDWNTCHVHAACLTHSLSSVLVPTSPYFHEAFKEQLACTVLLPFPMRQFRRPSLVMPAKVVLVFMHVRAVMGLLISWFFSVWVTPNRPKLGGEVGM